MSDRDANPCFECDTDCCSHYTIFVTGEDVARLARHLDVSPDSFVFAELEILTEELPEITLEGAPAQLALRTRDDRCCFQDPESRLCLVHEVRPFICRLYPHEVEDDRYLRLVQRNDVICPGPFPLRHHQEQEMLHEAHAFWITELPAWEELVARWNRGHGTESLAAFLAYALPHLD